MSIFQNIFGSGQSNVVPPNADVSAGPNPNAPNGTPQNQTQTQQEPQGLDKFSGMWTPPSAEELAKQNAPMFNPDPAKVTEAAAQVDFTKMLKPEILAAMEAGGAEGVKASLGAMNAMVQAVHAQNALSTAKIVEHAVTKAKEDFTSQLPSLVKRTQLDDTLMQENPAFSHPAAQPIIKALQTQLAQKFPQATTAELAALSKEYLGSFADVIRPTATTTQEVPKGEDWEKFFDPNQSTQF